MRNASLIHLLVLIVVVGIMMVVIIMIVVVILFLMVIHHAAVFVVIVSLHLLVRGTSGGEVPHIVIIELVQSDVYHYYRAICTADVVSSHLFVSRYFGGRSTSYVPTPSVFTVVC